MRTATPSSFRRPALWGTTAALTAAGVTVALAAGSVPGTPGSVNAGVLAAPIPVATSDNVSLLTTVPETSAISLEFARTGDYAYISSLDTISVLDTSDPRSPQIVGTLANAMFENEAMTYGERRTSGGQLERFVIAGIDLYQASPDDPEHVNVLGNEIAIVDVTDPANPFIRSYATTTTSTHTVQCVSQEQCDFAYSAGDSGQFSILDLRDLDAPKELGTAPSPAAGPNPIFTRGAGHYWDFDGVYGWHTGSGGAAAFDVSNPTKPRLVNTTDATGRAPEWNDFILHNSMRPNAKSFRPNAQPSLENGNVLLVTEEDYANDGDEVLCDRAGSFQTWWVRGTHPSSVVASSDPQPTGTVTPLDKVTVADLGGGLSAPASAFCSAHWFDVHQDGYVAQGWYGAGLRILDVTDPRNIAQYGYATTGATEVWDAYWVPQRDENGVAQATKTNVLYTIDTTRGLDVYEVTLPEKPAAKKGKGASAGAPRDGQ